MSNYSGNPYSGGQYPGSNPQSVPAVQPPQPAVRTVPSSWLAPAIVSTLCCFAPSGVVAVYFASQVNAYWNAGNPTAAIAAAKQARRWVIITMALWAAAMVFMIATGRLGALFESGVITGT